MLSSPFDYPSTTDPSAVLLFGRFRVFTIKRPILEAVKGYECLFAEVARLRKREFCRNHVLQSRRIFRPVRVGGRGGTGVSPDQRCSHHRRCSLFLHVRYHCRRARGDDLALPLEGRGRSRFCPKCWGATCRFARSGGVLTFSHIIAQYSLGNRIGSPFAERCHVNVGGRGARDRCPCGMPSQRRSSCARGAVSRRNDCVDSRRRTLARRHSASRSGRFARCWGNRRRVGSGVPSPFYLPGSICCCRHISRNAEQSSRSPSCL